MNEEQEEQADPLPMDAQLELVIEKISTEHGFDVRGYRRTTLYRRIRKRMADAACSTISDYLARLDNDRHEHALLINTILINVTRLFRDPEAWEFLQQECLLPLVRRKPPGEPIRIWSAGCASGEEAYTVAICLAELLGEAALRDIKIYATDVDDEALAAARAGLFRAEDVESISEERRGRFFDPQPQGGFKIRRDLRATVIFGRHNILQDPPISRLDLLICRNVLIYFDSLTQRQLLSRFHYAVRADGLLFLGKAETLMARSALFRPVEPRFRIFQRLPSSIGSDLGLEPVDSVAPIPESTPGVVPSQSFTLQIIINQSPDPMLLLDAAGHILLANEPGRELFHITNMLMGRNFLELEECFRPLSLRLALEDVRAKLRPVRVEEVQFPRLDGATVSMSIDLMAIPDWRGGLARILIWGHDRTRERKIQAELLQVRRDLETANEELQCTNEELETANEELQCTNEELETTNEELQSTNEELETTIEELQSTNEELETANDELRVRQEELNSLARYQETVLSSLMMGVIALDLRGNITSWNKSCQESWGVREAEAVGQSFLSLDVGLPLEQFREPLMHIQQGRRDPVSLDLEAVNRRGRSVRCHVRINPLQDDKEPPERAGAIILIEEH